ncbi:short chain dehydrogenase [Rhodococcus wratislaviensis]|nr:short chain dehydrogenase [Rhodococcus wratislaviensis]
MIAPTGRYNVGPITSPEKAAAMVVRALIERPKRIDVPTGTLGELGRVFAPAVKDRVMHQMYRMFPDSPAAKGQSTDDAAPAPQPTPEPRHHTSSMLGRAARKVGRLVPGTHW